MLRNYLIIAWRNLWNNKVFSLINIIGLSVTMAACFLIYVYISYETSYDNFHENGDNIYRLVYTPTYEGIEKPRQSRVAPFVGDFLQSNFPEIESYVRIFYDGRYTCTRYESKEDNETHHVDNVFFTDPSITNIFSFQFLIGNEISALTEPNTVVISESLAKKFFDWDSKAEDADDILDKTIWQNYRRESKITAVVKDMPDNSHLKFDALFSIGSIINGWWPDYNDSEDWDTSVTYFVLNPHTDVPALTNKAQELLDQRMHTYLSAHNENFKLEFQPIREIHLGSSDFVSETEPRGNIQTIRILLISCFLIIIIAWINYINLTTSRSLKRSKEVGIKKIVGAGRKQLVEQFLLESALVNLLALLLAITLAQVMLPYFEQFVGKDLQGSLLRRELVPLITSFLMFGILISGLYPAILLSSLKSKWMVRGNKNPASNRAGLRKYLVVMQYAITFGMLIGTFTMYLQLSFMQNANPGFNAEQMLVVERSGPPGDGQVKYYNAFKNKLKVMEGIVGVTASNFIPGDPQPDPNVKASTYFWIGDESKRKQTQYPVYSVDHDFFDVYDINIKHGRALSEIEGQDMQAILLMQLTARDMGFDDPEDALLGNIYTFKENRKFSDTTRQKLIRTSVIGIVDDFNLYSLKSNLQPMVFQKRNSIKKHRSYNYYSIRLKVPEEGYDRLADMISLVEKAYHEAVPLAAFNYFFLDDFFNQQYKHDQKIAAIVGYFGILSILVACLGMLGLSLFTLEQRTKEIGIRKVHGASITRLFTMLSRDFIKLVILSIIVAIPFTILPLRAWLQSFAHRIDLSWWIFAIPAIAIVLVALITIGFQSLKAALANPVKALRYE